MLLTKTRYVELFSIFRELEEKIYLAATQKALLFTSTFLLQCFFIRAMQSVVTNVEFLVVPTYLWFKVKSRFCNKIFKIRLLFVLICIHTSWYFFF